MQRSSVSCDLLWERLISYTGCSEEGGKEGGEEGGEGGGERGEEGGGGGGGEGGERGGGVPCNVSSTNDSAPTTVSENMSLTQILQLPYPISPQ